MTGTGFHVPVVRRRFIYDIHLVQTQILLIYLAHSSESSPTHATHTIHLIRLSSKVGLNGVANKDLDLVVIPIAHILKTNSLVNISVVDI